jgi:hypothetical protein
MPRTIYDPNPHISILEDGRVKKQIAEQARRALDMADRMKELPPLTAEEIEAERFQYESNAYAADNPLYAAARAASAHFLVVPLHGTDPLVRPADATRDAWQIFNWWSTWPEANPGILLGRAGGVFAIRVQDNAAWERLRDMAAVPMRDDNDKTWTEYRHIGGAMVRLLAPSRPFSMRSRGGWGRDFDRAAAELARESRSRNPQAFFLVWSYPSVVSGLDAFDYRTKTIAEGVKLYGDHAVMPWDGAILDKGVRVAASTGGRPPEAPLWLSKRIGNPRSRKVMVAAREAYEAALRVNEAHVIGEAEARRASAEAARRLALADQEQARKALAKAEGEEQAS